MKKILAAILALILAAFSFAALGESIPTDVSGLWHAYLADGESTLFLRVDGTGSLMVGESSYNVAWSQSGSALILDQGGALVEGVCEEDLISLDIGGGNLVFFRELPEPMPLECALTGVWRAPPARRRFHAHPECRRRRHHEPRPGSRQPHLDP